MLSHCAGCVAPTTARRFKKLADDCTGRFVTPVFDSQTLPVEEVGPNSCHHRCLQRVDDIGARLLARCRERIRCRRLVDRGLETACEFLAAAARPAAFARQRSLLVVPGQDLVDPRAAEQAHLGASEPLRFLKREALQHVLAHDEADRHDVAIDARISALSLVPVLDHSVEGCCDVVRGHAAWPAEAANGRMAGAKKLSAIQVMTGTVTASPNPNSA